MNVCVRKLGDKNVGEKGVVCGVLVVTSSVLCLFICFFVFVCVFF